MDADGRGGNPDIETQKRLGNFLGQSFHEAPRALLGQAPDKLFRFLIINGVAEIIAFRRATDIALKTGVYFDGLRTAAFLIRDAQPRPALHA